MIGRTLGHYRILEAIGAGGMGQVYRARDELLRREVAIKLLPAADTTDPASRARLLREARLASSLNHPNVCTIHEAGEQDGQAFIAMELVEGRALRDLIPAGGLPAADVLRLGLQIADALAHAHAHGVMHRDLKTTNVMVTGEGRVKVLDFGLARRMATDASVTQGHSSQLTEAGVVVGTMHYLAPEVLRGSPPDARSDIWALGVVLFEMACGTAPFLGRTSFEVSAAILNSEPGSLPDSVPAGLRAVVGRCLEKDPGQRYQATVELRAALEALRHDPAAGSEPRVARVRGTARGRWIGAGAGAAIVVGLLALGQLVSDRPGCTGVGPAVRSLAVLPLVNLSGAPDQDFLVDGMTDELITELAGVASLRVIARGSIMEYKGTRKSLRQIARELGVDALVEGSVTRAGDRVRVRARLSKGRTGESLWAESYERDLRDVLAMQSDVARAIVGRIRARLAPREEQRLTRSKSADPDVVQAYLKGRHAWNQYTLEGFREAQRQFQVALDRDPTYAPAWAGKADAAYGLSSIHLPPEVALREARAAAEMAIRLDPGLAEAHTSLGIVQMVYDWNWQGALESFERALALKPSSADAHWWRARWLLLQGRFDEALAEGRAVLELDPLSSWYDASQGWNLYFAGRYEEAATHLREGIRLHPDDYVHHVFLGLVLERQGDFAGAVRELERAVSMDENNDDLVQLAHAYGAAGRTADAERTIDRLLERRESGFVPAANLAIAYAGLRREAETLRWIEAAVDDHSEMLLLIGIDPSFDWIRAHPRFQSVLRRIRLRF